MAKSAVSADSVIFAKEILNGKLHFCAVFLLSGSFWVRINFAFDVFIRFGIKSYMTLITYLEPYQISKI